MFHSYEDNSGSDAIIHTIFSFILQNQPVYNNTVLPKLLIKDDIYVDKIDEQEKIRQLIKELNENENSELSQLDRNKIEKLRRYVFAKDITKPDALKQLEELLNNQ